MQANVIVRVFLDADLRNSHEGLWKLAKDNRTDLNKLVPGQFVVFINTRQTAFKVALGGHNLVYYRNPENKKIDLGVIASLPKYFDGTDFQYSQAARDDLLRKLGVRTSKTTVIRRPQTTDNHATP